MAPEQRPWMGYGNNWQPHRPFFHNGILGPRPQQQQAFATFASPPNSAVPFAASVYAAPPSVLQSPYYGVLLHRLSI
jgi:hypothetical protein